MDREKLFREIEFEVEKIAWSAGMVECPYCYTEINPSKYTYFSDTIKKGKKRMKAILNKFFEEEEDENES